MGWVKIADHVVLSGVATVWDSPMVDVGVSPMIQISIVSHHIVGTGPNLDVQPQTTDDLLDTPVNNGADSDITVATTTRIVRVLSSAAYGRYVRVRCTLTGTLPTATISIYVGAYPAS